MLTEDERYEIGKRSGQRIKERLTDLKSNGSRFTKKGLQKMVDRIVEEERRRARFQVIKETISSLKE